MKMGRLNADNIISIILKKKKSLLLFDKRKMKKIYIKKREKKSMLVMLTYKSLQNRNYFKSKILYRVDLNKTEKK